MGRTRPRSVISPVIATSPRTGMPVRALVSAVASAIPADGPSFGVAPAGTGAPQGDRSKGVNGFVLNTITPETDTTCHYFWAFARNYCLGEQRLTHELREGVASIFREDELILESLEDVLESDPLLF